MTQGTTIPVIIAIGSNLADAAGHTPGMMCRAAVEALRGLAGLRLTAVSRWYRSLAWPPSDQPDYINGVALLAGAADPARLLGELHAIEARAGRYRGVANAARPLDLDIIDMGGMVRASPDPILPHPRAHLRDFVLRPIADVLPGWRHPVSGETVADLLAAIRGDLAEASQAICHRSFTCLKLACAPQHPALLFPTIQPR